MELSKRKERRVQSHVPKQTFAMIKLSCLSFYLTPLFNIKTKFDRQKKKNSWMTHKKRQNQWINEFLLVCQQYPSFFYFYGSSFLWSTHYMSQCCIPKKENEKIKENWCNFQPAENQHTKNGYTHLCIILSQRIISISLFLFHICLKTISWIRRKDYHLLTVGLTTYSSDERFSALHLEDSEVILISYQVFSYSF